MLDSKPTPLTVNVIGGGLAGLVAALELVARGISVDLYEASGHLGGKAASIRKDLAVYDGDQKLIVDEVTPAHSTPSDHGYHVFPLWYVNMRALWTRIGLPPEEVFESGEYYALHRGPAYRFTPPETPSERKRFSLLDLITREDDEVEDLSFRGFLYSRIYNDLDSVSLNELFLNALSIPEYDISSRVVRNLYRQWFPVINEKNWAALKGDLSTVLIDRIERAIEAAAQESGASFNLYLDHALTKLTVEDNSPRAYISKLSKNAAPVPLQPLSAPIVLAVPMDVLRSLQNDSLFYSEPCLRNLPYLRANQFGALDIWFKRRIHGVPTDHFDLLGSKYNLSAFDITTQWKTFGDYEGTVMQFVAGNCRQLHGLSTAYFVRALLEEISEYMPDANAEGIAYLVPHPNVSQPLFVNDVGTWDKRPPTRGEHFFFAGDFVRNDTDITSMEGAVRSGMDAAEAIRRRYRPETEPVNVLPPMGMREEEIKKLRLEKVVPGRALMFMKHRVTELFSDL